LSIKVVIVVGKDEGIAERTEFAYQSVLVLYVVDVVAMLQANAAETVKNGWSHSKKMGRRCLAFFCVRPWLSL
jgi:hypothetical protein